MNPKSLDASRSNRSSIRLSKPDSLKATNYVYGVEPLDGNEAWALFEASALGDAPRARTLLAKDGRLANAQYWYQFPIHLAVYAGHLDLVRLLLEAGTDPGQSRFTYNSWDKLLCAAQARGYDEIASVLVQAMRRKFNYTPDFEPLKQAIISGDRREIDAVVEARPDLTASADALGNGPLHWSVITRQRELLKWFVARGAPVNAPRADGQTPLLLAVNGGLDYWYRANRGKSHPSLRNTWLMAGALLELGADYSLSAAVAAGDQQRVEQLLREDPQAARRLDSARISPLTYAAGEGHLHLARLLLAHGADPNSPEDLAPRGGALFAACRINHLDLVKVLLEHGADPNAGVDSSGCCLTIGEVYHSVRAKPVQRLLRHYGATTPPYAMSGGQLKRAILDRHEVVWHEEFLDCVMGRRDSKLLDLYLQLDPDAVRRFDVGTADPYLRSPTLVRHLLERGLDPNRPDWLGKTFLHTCAETGARSVAAILLDAGADINARELEHHGTPLAAAVRACPGGEPALEERQARMVEFLVKRGAATQLPDDESWSTPMAWANLRGLKQIAKRLKEYAVAS